MGETLYRREWLNNKDAGGSAFAIGDIDCISGKNLDYFDASLKIGDCERVVTLDFGVYGNDALVERRAKAKKLLSVVRQFHDTLIQQIEEIERTNK